MDFYHESVLVSKLPAFFPKNKGFKAIDATEGTGGHSLILLEGGARVLGIDRDPEMLRLAEERLKGAWGKDIKLIQGNFTELEIFSKAMEFYPCDFILMDLGVSNIHLTSEERGFSFNSNARLDMRLDRATQMVTGADLMNLLREDQLEDLFRSTLTKIEAKRVARAIIYARESKKIVTSKDFLKAVKNVLPKEKTINPATRLFLALRIAVNSELENLKEVLPKAFSILSTNGRLAIICFHSKEEQLILDFAISVEKSGKGLNLTTEPVRADYEEVRKNPRSRSAKLYVFEKL